MVTDRSAAESAVIDPGDEHERLIAHIEDRGHRVRLILCTHAHYDHVGAVAALSRHTAASLSRAPRRSRALEARTAVRAGLRAEVDPAAEGGGGLRRPREIRAGGAGLRVRAVPRPHAGERLLPLRGSRSSWAIPSSRGSGGAPTCREETPAALERSIAALLEEFEGDLVLFPGHGEPWTLDEARRWWAEQGTREARMKADHRGDRLRASGAPRHQRGPRPRAPRLGHGEDRAALRACSSGASAPPTRPPWTWASGRASSCSNGWPSARRMSAR